MIDLPLVVLNAGDARRTIDAITDLTCEELPFAASITQLARQSHDFGELERTLADLYVVALEARHPFLPDLVDMMLRWIERTRDLSDAQLQFDVALAQP